MLLGALRSALSAKLADQKLTVVDEWSLDSHKTKALAEALGNLNHKKSALIVSHGENRNLELASRNLERVKLVAPNAVQAYDLLNHDLLLLSKEAVARLVRTLDPEAAEAATPHVESIAPAPAAKKAAPKAAKSGAKKPAAKKTAKPGKKGK
jgi:ribosomal protein L4